MLFRVVNITKATNYRSYFMTYKQKEIDTTSEHKNYFLNYCKYLLYCYKNTCYKNIKKKMNISFTEIMPIDFNLRWNICQHVFKSNIEMLRLASGNFKRSKVKNTRCNIRLDGVSPSDFSFDSTNIKCTCSNPSGCFDTDPILSRFQEPILSP